MTRPLYEKDSDLEKEKMVIRGISKIWKCEWEKLHLKYQLDYLLLRNNLGVAWVEIKIRKNPIKQYSTYMIALSKVTAARSLSEASKLPSFLVVWWTDGLRYIRMDSLLDFSLGVGGRKDRNDEQDIEPVVLIPIENFIDIWLPEHGDRYDNL